MNQQDFPAALGFVAFKGNGDEAPIRLEELEREYCQVTRQPYPIPEMIFARSWMLFRVRV